MKKYLMISGFIFGIFTNINAFSGRYFRPGILIEIDIDKKILIMSTILTDEKTTIKYDEIEKFQKEGFDGIILAKNDDNSDTEGLLTWIVYIEPLGQYSIFSVPLSDEMTEVQLGTILFSKIRERDNLYNKTQ